jgi:hypothetical protein
VLQGLLKDADRSLCCKGLRPGLHVTTLCIVFMAQGAAEFLKDADPSAATKA